MGKESTYIYKIEHFSKIFGHKFILNDLSFNINQGEIFGIIGSSGCGKTTLLTALVGFIIAEKGDIKFRNAKVLNEEDKKSFRSIYKLGHEMKKSYGFAPQTPSFYQNLTIKENINYFGSLYGLSRRSIKSNTEYLLNLLGLTQSQHVIAKKLSGGMQRRLDIACALIHDPKVLILDEPTADLDAINAKKIWNLLKIINQRGTTIIIASHHIAYLDNFCDRVLILKDGHIAAIGMPDEIKTKNAPEEKIFFKSTPGKYEKIIKELAKKVKTKLDYEIKNQALIIHSHKPTVITHELLQISEKFREQIKDLEVTKPTLDRAFIMIHKEEQIEEENFIKGKEEEEEPEKKKKKKEKKIQRRKVKKNKKEVREVREKKKQRKKTSSSNQLSQEQIEIIDQKIKETKKKYNLK